MMPETLQPFYDAMRDLQRPARTDNGDHQYLNEVLTNVLEHYGFEICNDCGKIVACTEVKDLICANCFNLAEDLKESDDYEYRTRSKRFGTSAWIKSKCDEDWEDR